MAISYFGYDVLNVQEKLHGLASVFNVWDKRTYSKSSDRACFTSVKGVSWTTKCCAYLVVGCLYECLIPYYVR